MPCCLAPSFLTVYWWSAITSPFPVSTTVAPSLTSTYIEIKIVLSPASSIFNIQNHYLFDLGVFSGDGRHQLWQNHSFIAL
jgi:hypothetical protein